MEMEMSQGHPAGYTNQQTDREKDVDTLVYP